MNVFLIFRGSNASKTWTKYLLYDKETALKIYRSLQILNTQINNAICQTVLPGTMIFVVVVQTISCFVCIKFHTALPLPLLGVFSSVATFCLIFELFTYPLEANVYEKSVAFLRMNGGSISKERRLAKRALRKLGVSVGKAYVIQRQTPLTLISFVISITSNLLVSTT